MTTQNLQLMPSSIDCEEAVIGSILSDNSKFFDIELLPEDFYHSHLKAIYKAISDMFKEGLNVDIITLSQRLESKDKLEEVGGLVRLTEIMTSVPTSSHIKSYAQSVKENAVKRNFILFAEGLKTKCLDHKKDTEYLIDYSQKCMDKLLDKAVNDEVLDTTRLNRDVYDYWVKRKEIKEKGIPLGLNTEFQCFHFERKELITLVAHSGVGKSIMAMELAVNISKKEKVLYFSFEMSKEEIMFRAYSCVSKIPESQISNAEISTEKMYEIAAKFQETCKNFKILDRTITIQNIYNICKKEKMQNGLDFVVIDYVQITADSEDLVPKTQKVTRIAKEIAQNLDVCVLQLSQFNRDSEKINKDPMPKSYEILGGSSVKQNSNQVFILHNDTLAKDQYETIEPNYILRLVKSRKSMRSKADYLLSRKQDCMNFTTSYIVPKWAK